LAEPCFTNLEALVEAAAKALLPSLDKPFAFFGHSMGALVCFELARYLTVRYALSPLHIFVSGHSAPHIPAPYKAGSVSLTEGASKLGVDETQKPLYVLPDHEFVQEIRSLNGMSEQVLENQELMKMLLPILRADFELCETYVYRKGPLVHCPITALGGVGDPYVDRESLEAWGEQTSASCLVRMFPGDHFYLHGARQSLLCSIARELLVDERRVSSDGSYLSKFLSNYVFDQAYSYP
jgi:medium-chain acyl-[acyl-carrier-protein] hydrolase